MIIRKGKKMKQLKSMMLLVVASAMNLMFIAACDSGNGSSSEVVHEHSFTEVLHTDLQPVPSEPGPDLWAWLNMISTQQVQKQRVLHLLSRHLQLSLQQLSQAQWDLHFSVGLASSQNSLLMV